MIWGYVVPLAMTARKFHLLYNKGLKKAENTRMWVIIGLIIHIYS